MGGFKGWGVGAEKERGKTWEEEHTKTNVSTVK